MAGLSSLLAVSFNKWSTGIVAGMGFPTFVADHGFVSSPRNMMIHMARVGGSRSKEQDRKSELVLRSTYQIFEQDRNNSDRNFYNVVRYIHIPLVTRMQERSKAERRAIWPCLIVGNEKFRSMSQSKETS